MPLLRRNQMLGLTQSGDAAFDEIMARLKMNPNWKGFQHRKLAKGFRTLVTQPLAYVNHGRWVADCPTCNGGIAVDPDEPKGACLDCGTIYIINFPPPAAVARAELVLMRRPDEDTRNWHPDLEDIQDLKVQNITRGVTIT